jgi:NADH:ubiquinone reductase (non-electrogenic)
VLNTRVASVSEGHVSVVDKAGVAFDIPFGACVWSTGIAMNPLAQQLKELFPEEQTHARCGAVCHMLIYDNHSL